MAEAVQGIDVILLFRLLKEAKNIEGAKLAFQTEHEVSETRDSDSLATKDGAIVTPQALETEITCTSIMAKDDTMVTLLRDAQRTGDTIEIWEIDRSQPDPATPASTTPTKFKATYYQGKVTEWTKNPTAEDALEINLTFAVEGEGQDGYATLTAAQASVVQYVFADTIKKP